MENAYCSLELDKIAEAMAKARLEYKRIENNRDNPFFKSKYTDLDAILHACLGALSKHGVWFVQQERFREDGTCILHTRLVHSSGQWIESRALVIPQKGDVQSFGSTLSYRKRYSAETILGFTSSNDPLDDDGESSVDRTKTTTQPVKQKTYSKPVIDEVVELVTHDQLNELFHELGEHHDILKMLLEKGKIDSLMALPKAHYRKAMQFIQQEKSLKINNVVGA